MGAFLDYFCYFCENISSLTTGEIVSIITTYTIMYESKSYDCFRCLSQFPGQPEKTVKAKLKYIRTAQRCKEPSEKPLELFPLEYAGIKVGFRKCIGNYYSLSARDLIRFKDQYSTGMMKYAGSYGEQPAKFIEAMELISSLENARRSTETKDKGHVR